MTYKLDKALSNQLRKRQNTQINKNKEEKGI